MIQCVAAGPPVVSTAPRERPTPAVSLLRSTCDPAVSGPARRLLVAHRDSELMVGDDARPSSKAAAMWQWASGSPTPPFLGSSRVGMRSASCRTSMRRRAEFGTQPPTRLDNPRNRDVEAHWPRRCGQADARPRKGMPGRLGLCVTTASGVYLTTSPLAPGPTHRSRGRARGGRGSRPSGARPVPTLALAVLRR
jgi:hypothetical protein